MRRRRRYCLSSPAPGLSLRRRGPRRRCAVVGNFTSVVSPAFAGAGSGSPVPADQRQPHRSDHSSPRRSLRPSPPAYAGAGFGIGKEPACLQFTTTVATQPAQADRLARDHLFEDRAPPLLRRRSPNAPSEHSISAPVLRLPRRTESYSRRVGQADFGDQYGTEHDLCACPSAKAGGRASPMWSMPTLAFARASLSKYFDTIPHQEPITAVRLTDGRSL